MKLRNLAFLLSSLLVLGNCGDRENQPGFEVNVFTSGDEGYACFRIPAIILSPNGDLLAFAEGRRDGCSDTGDIDIVLKRSSDQGKTWDALEVVMHRAGYTSGNPAPVVDSRTGIIHLLYTQNLGEDAEHEIIDGVSSDTRRIHHMKSMDDGRSWTKTREITDKVKRSNWTWYATGPGSGVQLTSSKFKDRLVIGCDHIEAGTKQYFSHVIFSDDGENWQLGGTTPQDQVNECEVTELSNGDLLLNMRNYDRSIRTRRISRSTDGGKSWSDITADTTLIEPICQASLHRHPFSGADNLHFFSNPASDSSRTNMSIRMSRDDCKTWAKTLQVYEGPSAYSDLVSVDRDHLGLLYEGGSASPYESIRFTMVPISDFE